MVSSVSGSSPYSAYDVQNTSASSTAATTGTTSSGGAPLPTDTVTLSDTVQSLLSKFVTTDSDSTSNVASNAIATLLGGGDTSGNSIAQLLNGTSSSSSTSQFQIPTDGINANVYAALLKAAYNAANQKAGAAVANATTSSVQSSIDAYNATQNAANAAASAQHTKDVLAANTGVLPDDAS